MKKILVVTSMAVAMLAGLAWFAQAQNSTGYPYGPAGLNYVHWREFSVTVPATDANFLVDLFHAQDANFTTFPSGTVRIMMSTQNDPTSPSASTIMFKTNGVASSTTSAQWPPGGFVDPMTSTTANKLSVVCSGDARKTTVIIAVPRS